jgi:hypothetical protein
MVMSFVPLERYNAFESFQRSGEVLVVTKTLDTGHYPPSHPLTKDML